MRFCTVTVGNPSCKMGKGGKEGRMNNSVENLRSDRGDRLGALLSLCHFEIQTALTGFPLPGSSEHPPLVTGQRP